MDSLNVYPKSRSPSPGRLNAVKVQEYVGVSSLKETRGSRSRSPTCRHQRCNSSDAGMMRDIFGSQLPADDGPSLITPALQQQHEDDLDVSVLNGSMDLDDGNGRKAAIEHMHSKIARTKDRIKGEQTARDENVNEYLKLASHADKSQVQRIKAVFEKKNQKSAQSIQQLQKKLESYSRKVRELEAKAAQHASASHHHHRQPREVLRDMGQGLKHVGGNIRDGITGLSGSVMSKPREFAHLIRNKFGSADNINSLSRNGESDSLDDEKTHHGSATLPGGCSLGSGLKFTSEEGSECSSVTSESVPGGGTSGGATGGGGTSGGPHLGPPTSPLSSTAREAALTSPPSIEFIYAELRSRKTESDRLRDKIESVKDIVQKDVAYLTQALMEERFRCERLEEQVNDLTELHQNEVENLKTAVADMEEKVQYQSEERLRDIHDMLEACQTKISKMEHQQAQHQQYLTLEGLDNSNARALIVKLINVVLMVLQVILLLVATVAGIIMPFLRTRLRVLSTAVLVIAFVIVMKQWSEISEASQSVTSHLGSLLLSRS